MLKSNALQTRVLVKDSVSGKLRPFVDNVDIKASSHGAPWEDAVLVEHNVLPATEMAGGYIDRTTIVQPLVEYDVAAIRLGDPQPVQNSLKGVIHIDPSGALTGARWSKPLSILFVMPSETIFERVARELPASYQQLARTSFVHDPQIQQIGLALLAECQAGFSSGRLYGESLAMALSARLINSYSVEPQVAPAEKHGLPAWRLRKVMEFIEANVHIDLGLSELAEVAGFSEYHFSRLFKLSTGEPPHRYVTGRRVERAKELLAKSPMSIIEISLLLGFADQAHLTTVFKRHTGITPRKYREQVR